MADFCLLPARSSTLASFLVETRCIIDGWLIGNSITQRLLGWQTVGHRYPVRTIELECRRGGKVSFRDAAPLSADLLGMPNGHCLVQPLTDDLPQQLQPKTGCRLRRGCTIYGISAWHIKSLGMFFFCPLA